MKRLLAMLSAAVTAIGLQAAEPYPSGTDFNDEGWPSETEAKLWTTTSGLTPSSDAYTYTDNDFRGDSNVDSPVPFQFNESAAGANLKIETGSLTTSVYRAISVTDDENTPVTQTIGDGGILVDTLVKFTAFDDDANLAATDENAKFAVWVKEVEGEDENAEPTYQLMVTAGKWDSSGTVTPTAYICTLDQNLGATFSLTNWFRLTVKAIPEVWNGGQIPGFVVCVNGLVVTSDAVKNDIKVSDWTLSTSASGWANGAIFPSLVAGDQTIKQVGFAGTGWIDDLSITDTIPTFIADKDFFYLAGGEHIAKFTCGDQTWEKGGDPLQFVMGDAATVTVTGIVCDDGYFLASTTEEVKVSSGETTTIGESAAKIAATVTIDGTATHCATLADAVTAINAAEADATLTLGADATGGITINNETGGITITIDLAGKTITQGEEDSAAIYVESDSAVIINDTVGGGVLQDNGSGLDNGAYALIGSGSTTLLNGTYNGGVSGNPLVLTDESTSVKILASANTEIEATLPEGKTLAEDGDGYFVLVEDTEATWKTLLGEPDTDGAYLIDNEDDLIALQDNAQTLGTKDVTFKLTDNIALTKEWKGIGMDKASDLGEAYAFEGTFDGNGKTISNVIFANLNTKNVTNDANNYRGFFGYVVGGTVRNLTVSGSGFGDNPPSAYGKGEYGGAMLVGELGAGATLEGCTAQGTIASSTHNACGVCVRLTGGTIKNCTNEAAITGGYTKAAGIVAISQGGGTIEGCVNKGDITIDGNAEKAGRDGVAGIIAYAAYNKGTVIVRNCTNEGAIIVGDTAYSSPTIGQIVGYNNANGSAKIEGTNTGLADVASVGKSDSGAIDGLTFATVSDTTATFVANDALALAGTYKVMAAGAAYEFAEVGSITFDTSLATVDVTMSTDLSSDDYEITEAKDAENEKVISYTLAKKATVQPVDPGVEEDCGTDQAKADSLVATINGDKATYIKVPEKLTEKQQSAYLELVAAKVVTTTTGDVTTYSVVVDLTAKAEETIQKQVDADTKALKVSTIAAATGDVSSTLTDVTPGLYYSVIAGATLDDMGVRSSTMATGDTHSVTLPHYDGAGFYRIEASVNAQPVK